MDHHSTSTRRPSMRRSAGSWRSYEKSCWPTRGCWARWSVSRKIWPRSRQHREQSRSGQPAFPDSTWKEHL